MTGGLIIKVGMHQISEGDANIPILAKKKNPFIYFFFFVTYVFALVIMRTLVRNH